jgi:DNA topoisomerase IA
MSTAVLSLLALRSVLTVTGFVLTDSASSRRATTTAAIHHRSRGPHLLFASTARYSLTTIPSVPKDAPYRLVIVESPSKCKTIANILDQYVHDNALDFTYVVTSCMGHLRNLPKSQPKDQPKLTVVGVDIDNAYTPTYVILPGKEGLVKELQQLAEHAQQVVIATDEDREGEAIGWHLQQLLSKSTPQVRVTFGEITKSAIYESIANPHSLDMDLVKAQETRRILDRLAGYTVSGALEENCAGALGWQGSVGRHGHDRPT